MVVVAGFAALLLVVPFLAQLLGTGAGPDRGTDQAAPSRPLLLVGGTGGEVSYLDDAKAYFEEHGFTVATTQLAGSPPGSVDIAESGRAVCERIDLLRARTGTTRVDVVGHSQGALAARHCVRFGGGVDTVATMVSLGGVNGGTHGVSGCDVTACRQMRPGSTFLEELNAGDATPGRVGYVHLYSDEDQGGIDGEAEPLRGGATNIAAQDLCPGKRVEHSMLFDSTLMRELIRAAVLRAPLTTDCR